MQSNFTYIQTFKQSIIMKKLSLLVLICGGILVLTNCNTPKNAVAKPKMTYEGSLQAVIATNCTPCHIPAKGGNKKPYDNYANVKTDIDEIIRRIELNPTDRGFMPFKHPKLSDSTINVFKQWRADGMLEK
jgi:hypothetical protein